MVSGGHIVPIGGSSGQDDSGDPGLYYPWRCGDQPYDPQVEDCCGDNHIVVPSGQCCKDDDNGNGTWYDPGTQECCGGYPATKGWCCQGNLYDPRVSCCADDGSIFPWGTCSWLRCNGRPYDSTKYSCCDDITICDSSQDHCCSDGYGGTAPIGFSCTDPCGTYDSTQFFCCGGHLYPSGGECCWDGSVATSGQCPPEPILCNGETIPDGQTCCYDHLVDIDTCPIPAIFISSDCESPCIVGTNQTIELNARLSNFGNGGATVHWQYPLHGDPYHVSEGESLTFTTEDLMLGQAVSILVWATDEYGRGASTNYIVNVPNIILTQAPMDGDNSSTDFGGAMPYVPVWTPNDGVGEGPLIPSSPPDPVFTMSFVGTDMQVTLLGANHVLKQLKTNPRFYKENSSGLTVRLNQEPWNDPGVVEYLEATVTYPSAGITDSLYACDETGAGNSAYVHNTPVVEMNVGTLSASQPDTIALAVDNNGQGAVVYSLTETGANTLVFTNGAVAARLLGNPDPNASLMVALTANDSGLSNTVMPLAPCGGSLYRNCALPSRGPDPDPDPVPDNAPFFVEFQLPGASDDVTNKLDGLSFTLKVDTAGGTSTIGTMQLQAIDGGCGLWRSAAGVLCAPDTDPTAIPGADVFQPFYAPPDVTSTDSVYATMSGGGGGGGGGECALMDANSGAGVQLDTKGLSLRTQLEAVVIGYQNDGKNTEATQLAANAARLLNTTYPYNGGVLLSKAPSLEENRLKTYFSSRDVWVSITHGTITKRDTDELLVVPPDHPNSTMQVMGKGDFRGLTFPRLTYTGSINDFTLTPEKIIERMEGRPKFRLVIASACCSAHVTRTSMEVASMPANSYLLNDSDRSRDFVEAFIGSSQVNDTKAGGVYFGWGWDINISVSKSMPYELLQLGAPGQTVVIQSKPVAVEQLTAGDVYQAYLDKHNNPLYYGYGARTLKVYGNTKLGFSPR